MKPNQSQSNLMVEWLAMLRAHYNYCLRDRIEAYEQAKFPKIGEYSDIKTKAPCSPLTCSVSKISMIGYPWKKAGKKRNALEIQSSELPLLKQSRPWYKSIHSTVLQQNLRRLDTAFKNFFDGGKGYPKFKIKQRFKSFSYPPKQIKIVGNSIYLPSIGWMTFFKSREIPDGFELRTVTIRNKADGWYVSIRIEDKSIPQSNPISLEQVESAIGCDLGVKKLVALSNGEQIVNPRFEERLTRTKTIRQRRASRKKKGSNNQKKAYSRLALIDRKITNQRTDYHWKVANKLVRTADVIFLEDLNIKGMIARCKPKKDENGKYLKNGQSAKKALNKLIRDCAWGELVLKIKSVAEKFGCIVMQINPKNTSRECPECGHIDASNRDGEKFLCTECGFADDADNNAGKNIGMKGLKILGLNPTKLLMVNQKVTLKSESTDLTAQSSQDISISLEIEPKNPVQLNLFQWINGEVTYCSESPTERRRRVGEYVKQIDRPRHEQRRLPRDEYLGELN